MGVVVRRHIDILIIIITFPYSTCISYFCGSNIPTSLFIFFIYVSLEQLLLKASSNEEYCNELGEVCEVFWL